MDKIEFATSIRWILQTHPLYTAIALSLGYSVYRWNARRLHIPTYGTDIPVLSFISAIRIMGWTKEVLEDAYKKYPIFRVPALDYWIVVVSGKYSEEFHRAPDDLLDPMEAVKFSHKIKYTQGAAVAANLWHLVRNLANILGSVQEELELGFEDELALDGHEWREINFPTSIRRIISRVTNRVFVGAPLCRNPEWRDLNVDYTVDAAKAGLFLGLFPSFIQPLIGSCLTHVRNSRRKAERLLVPLIEERYRLPPEERPNDMLSWLMEDAVGEERNPVNLTMRMLVVNMVSIHTTSMTFTYAMYQLLAHPECIQPLREEVESVISEQGWTRSSLLGLHRLDSFIRESLRTSGGFTVVMQRRAMKDFTFSDGTFIPKGTHLAVSSAPVNMDGEFYEDPLTFKPFRFAEARAAADDPKDSIKNQLATTSRQHLLFGHGKHACPGRFFAVSELKCLMAHILMNYDIKWPNRDFIEGGYYPPNNGFGLNVSPNEDASIMFRRRMKG